MHPTSFLSALFMASLAVASPTLKSRAGRCGVHVIQYQRNEPGTGPNYEIDARLNDPTGFVIGSLSRQPTSGTIPSSRSHLASDFVITTENMDSDPVEFYFGNQHWLSDGQQCSTGDYDSGSRQMDCTFDCQIDGV